MGAVIDKKAFGKIGEYIADAKQNARIVSGGETRGEAGYFIQPTLVEAPEAGYRLMREEIFGPLLPVVAYRDLDEAIAYVNARPRPLALYVFDRDDRAIEAVLARTTSGGVTVNDTMLHIAQEELPFGGVGPSGMGEYHGRAGFDTFSKRKAVFRPSRLSALKLLRPPYGARFEALLKLLLR